MISGPVKIGALCGVSKSPGGPWFQHGPHVLPQPFFERHWAYHNHLVQDEWRLVEPLGEGVRWVLCNTWRTSTMPAPAFDYYLAPVRPLSPSSPLEPCDEWIAAHIDPISGAISLDDFPADSPAPPSPPADPSPSNHGGDA